MNKWKITYIVLAVYELTRLLFIVSSQSLETQSTISLGWYANVPLIIIPFFLLFIHYKTYTSIPTDKNPFLFTASTSETMHLTRNLFLLQKAASCTGLLAFTFTYIKNTFTTMSLEPNYFLKSLPIVMIFFTIDVILCVTILLQQRNIDYTTEG